MELHLSLALPTHNPIEGFDRTNHVLESKQKVGSESRARIFCVESKKHFKHKRSFQDSFGHSLTVSSDSLLVWSGQPNEEDKRNGNKNRNTDTTTKNDKELVVGWPPIKEWRKKKLHLHQHHEGQIRNNREPVENKGRVSNSLYVKVKLEGVAIGRKIDLRLYNSYRTLTNTLISMFANYQNFKEEGASYTLTYQDKEGDWLIAGDVPWQSFIDSVQRLEILRNGNETT